MRVTFASPSVDRPAALDLLGRIGWNAKPVKLLALPKERNSDTWKALNNKHKLALLPLRCYHGLLPRFKRCHWIGGRNQAR
jgi:hypothetical protein